MQVAILYYVAILLAISIALCIIITCIYIAIAT